MSSCYALSTQSALFCAKELLLPQTLSCQCSSAVPPLKTSCLFFSVLASCAFPSIAEITTHSSSRFQRYENCSLLTGFVEIIQCEKFGETFEISSLNMKTLSGWSVEMGTVSSHQVAAELRTKTESRGSLKLATLFAALHDCLLREAEREPVRQNLTAFNGVQICAAS